MVGGGSLVDGGDHLGLISPVALQVETTLVEDQRGNPALLSVEVGPGRKRGAPDQRRRGDQFDPAVVLGPGQSVQRIAVRSVDHQPLRGGAQVDADVTAARRTHRKRDGQDDVTNRGIVK